MVTPMPYAASHIPAPAARPASPPISRSNPRLAAALELHRAGWAALCLHHPADTPTGCSCYNPTPGLYQRLICDKVAKHPRHRWRPRNGEDPLPDANRLAALWSKHPRSNVGWRMGGQPNGRALFTLDIDAPGLPWYETQEGALPATVAQRTQGGGLQLVYEAPAELVMQISNSVKRVVDGVDVRADGGLIVCAPSQGGKGVYTWLPGCSPQDRAPAPAPAWLLDLLPRRRADEPPPGPTRPQDAPAGGDLAALFRWARRGVKYGGRDNACYWLACTLAREGASDLDGRTIIEEFAAACDPRFDRAVALEKWSRAQKTIPYNPRPRRRTPPPPTTAAPAAPVRPPDVAIPDHLQELFYSMAQEIATLRQENDELRAWVNTPADEQIAALLQERDALQAWKERALDLLFGAGGAHLDITDRLQLVAAQHMVDQGLIRVGEEITTEQKDIAAAMHMPPATLGRWFDNLDRMGVTRHSSHPDWERPILDRKTGQPRQTKDGKPMLQRTTRLACLVEPFAVVTTTLHSPVSLTGNRQGGPGRRNCPHCGADGEKQEVLEVRRCTGCGTIYRANGAILASGTQNQVDIGSPDRDGPLLAEPVPQNQIDTGIDPSNCKMKSEAPADAPAPGGWVDARRAGAVLHADALHAGRQAHLRSLFSDVGGTDNARPAATYSTQPNPIKEYTTDD